MQIATTTSGKLLAWLFTAQRRAELADRPPERQIELHVVAQGYELRAEGMEPLFIEPDRR